VAPKVLAILELYLATYDLWFGLMFDTDL